MKKQSTKYNQNSILTTCNEKTEQRITQKARLNPTNLQKIPNKFEIKSDLHF